MAAATLGVKFQSLWGSLLLAQQCLEAEVHGGALDPLTREQDGPETHVSHSCLRSSGILGTTQPQTLVELYATLSHTHTYFYLTEILATSLPKK